jgi:O-antigen/teichoic acid export membrane protein
MRRLWLQVLQTSGAKIYALVAGLVVLSVTARYLGPSGRGVVVAATAWATLLSLIGGLSLGQVAIYRAAGRERSEWLPSTLATMVAFLMLVTAAAWAIAAIIYTASGGRAFANIPPLALALALLAVPLLIWTEYASSLLMALDALPVANLAQATGATVNAIVVVALLTSTAMGIHAPLVAILVGGAAAAALTGRAIIRQSQLDWPKWHAARTLLLDGLKLHANAIGTYLFTHASVLIVNYYRSPAETAFFGLAVQLVMVVQIVPASIGMVAYTLVGRLGPDAAWPEQRRLVGQSMIVGLALIGVAYAAAPVGVRLVAGSDFLPAVPLFRLMLPALLGMMLSSVMASQWIGRGMFTRAAGITLATGIVNVALTLMLVPRLGATGAALAALMVYALVILVNAQMAWWVERRPEAAQGSPELRDAARLP